MIQIQQVKLPLSHTKEDILKKAAKMLHIAVSDIKDMQIVKQSVDARKKPEIYYVYSLHLVLKQEAQCLKKVKKNLYTKVEKKKYQFPTVGSKELTHPPVVVGSGPGGLFACYQLALHGFHPLLIERGACVEERQKEVENFWKTGILNTKTNVQFGEGGAGTFSDGKLNTLVKDKFGRNHEVLRFFVEMGAPAEILYVNKPHIGTDVLVQVLQNIRKEIIRLGGTIRFNCCLTDLFIENNSLQGIEVNGEERIDTNVLVLAIGHSARDTFEMLHKRKIHMEAKAFAVGMRVEHPQSMINENQYGKDCNMKLLPVAPYKVTASGLEERGVYSFCMCPGGYVVNSSSEENRLVVNGMSYYKRDSANANSAIIVAVQPSDFPDDGPLAGIAFQRQLESYAYGLCNGKIPQQLYGDYKERKVSQSYGDFTSMVKGASEFTDLSELLPEACRKSFVMGMESFAKKIPGFNRYDAILSGVESRTSSPVRITRDESFQCNIAGIYPCGEGAGYAGGITSAAMDGMKVAEKIGSCYRA